MQYLTENATVNIKFCVGHHLEKCTFAARLYYYTALSEITTSVCPFKFLDNQVFY